MSAAQWIVAHDRDFYPSVDIFPDLDSALAFMEEIKKDGPMQTDPETIYVAKVTRVHIMPGL